MSNDEFEKVTIGGQGNEFEAGGSAYLLFYVRDGAQDKYNDLILNFNFNNELKPTTEKTNINVNINENLNSRSLFIIYTKEI